MGRDFWDIPNIKTIIKTLVKSGSETWACDGRVEDQPTAGHRLLHVCQILKIGNESEKITACRKRWKDCRKNGRGQLETASNYTTNTRIVRIKLCLSINKIWGPP
jgi:hypothetical protein